MSVLSLELPRKHREVLMATHTPAGKPVRWRGLKGGRDSAKCLAHGTQVIMADGSLRAVEQVRVGDRVMGPDSQPRNVLATSSGIGPLYRVKQTCGIDYVVNQDHILALRRSKSAKKDFRFNKNTGNPKHPGGRYASYGNAPCVPVTEFASQSDRWRYHFHGYKAGLISFDEKPVLIDPYILGAWLGDGSRHAPDITSADAEVVEACQEYAVANGCSLSRYESTSQGAARTYRMACKVGGRNPIWGQFKHYGLPFNKHIPADYLANSEHVRLRLLAGLLDTDGHRSENSFEISQSIEPLARQIKYLADCLGFRTSIIKAKTICTNNGAVGFAWRVNINGDLRRIPCKIARKCTGRAPRPDMDFLASRLRIEDAGVGAWAGFTLDGDHLFLLEDGTVTHNSWSNAKMALVRGVSKPERILYVRETQKSLADSAHQLLCDLIKAMGLQSYYTPQKQYIIGGNGTQISFNGLSTETADSLKSKEGTTICVIQEAQSISARSLDILIPTIRAPGSELWAEWNPEQETDAIDQRLVLNCPDDAIVAHVNYTDNPWRSKALDSDRETMQRTDPAKFAHVYLGQYLPAVEGAIYYNEVAALKASGRLCNVPYDPMLKVHVICDLGYNDFMSLIFVQRLMSEIRIIRYIEDRQRTIPSYSKEMRELGYNYGKVWLPHDAFATTLAASSNTLGATVDEQFRNLGWQTERVPNIDVEQGIRKTREVFPRCAYDKTHAVELLNRLGRYRRRVDAKGQAHAPVHDDQSHGSDGKRYVSLVADQLTNDAGKPVIADPYAGWRRHG